MQPPTPELIKSTRKEANMTQTQAGAVIYKSLHGWQNYESPVGSASHRNMDYALWELFLLKIK